MENTEWFKRWFTPYSKDCQTFYNRKKAIIDYYEKSVDWDTGIRTIVFGFGKSNKVTFTDTI